MPGPRPVERFPFWSSPVGAHRLARLGEQPVGDEGLELLDDLVGGAPARPEPPIEPVAHAQDGHADERHVGIGPELTGIDSGLDHLFHLRAELALAGDHATRPGILPEVELLEEHRPFLQVVGHDLDVVSDELPEPFGSRLAGVILADALEGTVERLLADLQQNVVLFGVVVVDGGFGDTEGGGQILHGGGVVALLPEDLGGLRQDARSAQLVLFVVTNACHRGTLQFSSSLYYIRLRGPNQVMLPNLTGQLVYFRVRCRRPKVRRPGGCLVPTCTCTPPCGAPKPLWSAQR